MEMSIRPRIADVPCLAAWTGNVIVKSSGEVSGIWRGELGWQ